MLSFNISKQVTETYSTSFSIAISWLRKDIQHDIYSIYGFVRLADEIVDTFHEFNKEKLLENLERDYYDGYKNGISINPILNSFQLTVKKYNIPDELVQAFLMSMKTDLYKNEYKNNQEMEQYIYGSANVVGLMCLKVFVNGNKMLYEELKDSAMSLGAALQKVNFLRDIKNDIEILERKYFPEVDMKKLHDNAKTKIIQNIEKDFEAALVGIKKLPENSKLAVYVAFCYYQALLKKLKRTEAMKVFTTRIRVSNSRKLLLFLKAYTQLKVKLI